MHSKPRQNRYRWFGLLSTAYRNVASPKTYKVRFSHNTCITDKQTDDKSYRLDLTNQLTPLSLCVRKSSHMLHPIPTASVSIVIVCSRSNSHGTSSPTGLQYSRVWLLIVRSDRTLCRPSVRRTQQPLPLYRFAGSLTVGYRQL